MSDDDDDDDVPITKMVAKRKSRRITPVRRSTRRNNNNAAQDDEEEDSGSQSLSTRCLTRRAKSPANLDDKNKQEPEETKDEEEKSDTENEKAEDASEEPDHKSDAAGDDSELGGMTNKEQAVASGDDEKLLDASPPTKAAELQATDEMEPKEAGNDTREREAAGDSKMTQETNSTVEQSVTVDTCSSVDISDASKDAKDHGQPRDDLLEKERAQEAVAECKEPAGEQDESLLGVAPLDSLQTPVSDIAAESSGSQQGDGASDILAKYTDEETAISAVGTDAETLVQSATSKNVPQNEDTPNATASVEKEDADTVSTVTATGQTMQPSVEFPASLPSSHVQKDSVSHPKEIIDTTGESVTAATAEVNPTMPQASTEEDTPQVQERQLVAQEPTDVGQSAETGMAVEIENNGSTEMPQPVKKVASGTSNETTSNLADLPSNAPKESSAPSTAHDSAPPNSVKSGTSPGDEVDVDAHDAGSPGVIPMDIEAVVDDGATKGADEGTVQRIEMSLDEHSKEPGAKDDSDQVNKGQVTPISVVFKPPTEEDTASLVDMFPQMLKRKKTCSGSSVKRPQKRRPEQLRIKITGIPVPAESHEVKSSSKRVKHPTVFAHDSMAHALPLLSEAESSQLPLIHASEFEDSLEFFSETHEEQDPVFIAFQQQKQKASLTEELANLQKQYDSNVGEVNQIIAKQMKDKQVPAGQNMERLRKKTTLEEQRDLLRLKQVYEEKATSNNNKINQGIKLLTQRHTQELQKAHLHHRQQAQQRGIPEEVSSAEWSKIVQRLQAKQQQQLSDFNDKGAEVKKKFEAEYLREKQKYVEYYERKSRELEYQIQKAVARMQSNYQQQRQRYMKRLSKKMHVRRNEILVLLGEPTTKGPDQKDDESETDSRKSKPELRSPDPVKIRAYSIDDPTIETSGAAVRYNHRKGILSTIQKQLSVEIHNEGLWISVISDKKVDDGKKDGEKNKGTSSPKADAADSKKASSNDGEFIPWGVKARSVLQTIISGEIPVGYGHDRFDFGDALASQGCNIRCVIMCLRTSEETASTQRASAMKEQEAASLVELEQKLMKLSQAVAESEKYCSKAIAEEKDCTRMHEKARRDVIKAKTLMDQLRNKCKRMLTPDDQPLPGMKPSDQAKLSQAVKKYRTNLETAQAREKAAESAVLEKKSRTQKVMALVKQAQRAASSTSSALRKKRAVFNDRGARARLSESAGAEFATTRVSNVIAALKKTAEVRREQLNQKRNASDSWVQGLPELSGALKKSLWHKMHRRRQQINLRPSMEVLLNDMKRDVEETTKAVLAQSKNVSREEVAQRSEAMFLLAAYPASSDPPLPPVPQSSSSDSWAEPGWHVNLNVPKGEEGNKGSLLPRPPSFPILQQNQAELCSTPGHQLATFLSTSHLKALGMPLSAAAQASSLGEISPVVTETELSPDDPFQLIDSEMMIGYTFVLKSPTRAASTQSRRKSVTKDGAVSPTPTQRHAAPPPAEAAEPKRSSSTGSLSRMASSKPDPPKRSRSKSGMPGTSPRSKSFKNHASSDAASALSDAVTSQARAALLQQQAAAANAALSARAAPSYYQQTQQQTQQQSSPPQQQQQLHRGSIEHQQQQAVAAAAQYSPGYLKQVQSPAQAARLQAALQPTQLQPHATQLVPTGQPQQQHLLPQPQYASPQQQYQQRQLAQMRMMQAAGFSAQQANNMRYFPAAALVRQPSYGNVAGAPPATALQQHPLPPAPPPQPRRQSDANDPNAKTNDTMYMLPEMQP